MKRKLSLAMLLVMLASAVLTSCASDSGSSTGETTTAADVAETTVAETEDPLADNLPEKDWNGETFRMYARDTTASIPEAKHLWAEAMDGDVINDAAYTSINNVREKYNVNFEMTQYETQINTANNSIGTMILAGDDVFEILSSHDRTMAQFSLAQMLIDVNTLDYIDLSKPWWPENAVNSMTIGGKMFLIASSMSTSSIAGTSATFFNKARMADYGIEEPYQTVKDGDWTLDMMIALSKDIYEDVNGDSTRDKGDFYGFVAQLNSYRIHESFGLQAYVPDDEEIIKLDIDKPSTYEFVDKYYNWLFESDGGIMTPGDADYREYFMNNSALFTFASLGNAVDYFRYADVEYGILPMPKVDEAQENYVCGANCVPIGVPITNKKLEFTGFVIEALSAEGHRIKLPAYFEIALKQKFTSDQESIEMLDIIADSINIDLGYLYCGDLPLCRIIAKMFHPNNPNKDFASFYAANKDKEQANIDAIIEAFGFEK